MTQEMRLLDAIGTLDDGVLLRAEAYGKPRPLRILPLAACLAVLLFAAISIPKWQLPQKQETTTPSPAAQTDQLKETERNIPQQEFSVSDEATIAWPQPPVYNKPEVFVDAARAYIPGSFTMPLDESTLAALLPQQLPNRTQITGSAFFDGTGTLLEVSLSVSTPNADECILVTMSEQKIQWDYMLSETPVISDCNGITYTLYRYDTDFWGLLQADAQIGATHFCFSVQSTDVSTVQSDFEQILACFTTYEAGKPNLWNVRAAEIPEWFDRELTWQEAAADPDFGPLWLPALPDGYRKEAIRRYKDQTQDTLSGLWTKGYEELSWVIRRFTEEDAERLVVPAERERYDLSLYPIPRAQSVPDELRQVVNHPVFDAEDLTPELVQARAERLQDAGDTDGWRMTFSVRYGDYLVSVRSKGVTPQWLYRQLSSIPKKG